MSKSPSRPTAHQLDLLRSCVEVGFKATARRYRITPGVLTDGLRRAYRRMRIRPGLGERKLTEAIIICLQNKWLDIRSIQIVHRPAEQADPVRVKRIEPDKEWERSWMLR
jgi:hypothetical protein